MSKRPMTEPDETPFPALTADQEAYFAEKRRRLDEALRESLNDTEEGHISGRSLEDIIEDARGGLAEGKRPFVSEDSMTRPGPPPPPLTPEQAAYLDAQDAALAVAIQEGIDDIASGHVADWSIDEIKEGIFKRLKGSPEE